MVAATDPRQEGAHIERLLSELRTTAGPPTWMRIEELLQRMLALYGAGLGRLLELVGETRALDEPLRQRLCGDELVSSLLVIHGLHPLSTAERVDRALATVRSRSAQAAALELVALDRGVAQLRWTGASEGALARAGVEEQARRAIEDEAPEVTRVEIEGGLTGGVPTSRGGLVQIDLARTGEGRERSP